MIKFSDPIAVFGAGSIGERHIGILQQIGYQDIRVYRQRNLPLRTITAGTIQIFGNLREIDSIRPRAAFICTPTSQHLQQALFCMERGIHVMAEKPLSHTSAGLEKLRHFAATSYIQVAYMLRYHPFFLKIKIHAETQEYGKLLSMQSYWGEYLPDWHPWEEYSQSYAARKELGGGAALTLSHDIDLLNWIAGSKVKQWHTLKNKSSSLKTDAESGADISMGYENGVSGHCHLNFHEKNHRRWYRFVFENASVEVDYLRSELTTYSCEGTFRQELTDFDRNELYQLQAIDFFRKINEKNFQAASLKNLDESQLIISMCQ